MRNRLLLMEEDFLTLFCSTSNKVIRILIQELENSRNNNIINDDENLFVINKEAIRVKLDGTAIWYSFKNCKIISICYLIFMTVVLYLLVHGLRVHFELLPTIFIAYFKLHAS